MMTDDFREEEINELLETYGYTEATEEMLSAMPRESDDESGKKFELYYQYAQLLIMQSYALKLEDKCELYRQIQKIKPQFPELKIPNVDRYADICK